MVGRKSKRGLRTERECFYSIPKSWRERGCKKEAIYRVILGERFTVDVCEDHVEGYRGMGYKIIPLRTTQIREVSA